MKKEKVIISSLIPTVLDSYTIGTGITAQNKSIKRKCMILVRPYRCSLSGNINRIGSKWIGMDLALLVKFNLTKIQNYFVPTLT